MAANDDKPTSGDTANDQKGKASQPGKPEKEVGGQKGLEPTRYGDWEKNGIISDF